MTWKLLSKFRNVLSLSDHTVYSYADKKTHSRENELDYLKEAVDFPARAPVAGRCGWHCRQMNGNCYLQCSG